MNHISIGTAAPELPPGGLLYLHDEVPKLPRMQYFDYRKHSFNLFADLTYRKICEIVDTFDALFMVTGGTLTESTGLTYIAQQLNHFVGTADMVSLTTLIPEPDSKSSTGHHWAYDKVQRILLSPVLRQVLCNPKPHFVLSPHSSIMARLNRAELGDFDALALGLFLISSYKGQIVIPDLGFYGRDYHTALIRENRLTAGVHSLDDLPDKLRRAVLSMPCTAYGTLYRDAITLTQQKGLWPDPTRDDNPYNNSIREMMQPPPEREPVPLWVPPPIVPVVRGEKRKRRAFRRAGGID